MGIPDNTHKASCDAVVALGSKVSVHTDDAGTTGANEATGGGYARQSATFPTGAMVSGFWVRTAPGVTVPVAAGTYKQGGLWSLVTGGSFVGSDFFANGDVIVVGTGASISVTSNVKA
jgi:hypothetical protein